MKKRRVRVECGGDGGEKSRQRELREMQCGLEGEQVEEKGVWECGEGGVVVSYAEYVKEEEES